MKKFAWLWLLVPLVGVWELLAQQRIHATPPTRADWKKLGAKVQTQDLQDTLVLVSPRWADPHLRAELGDDVIPLGMAARADDSGYARALEVVWNNSVTSLGSAAHGADYELFKRAPLVRTAPSSPAGWELLSVSSAGAFQLRLWENSDWERVQLDLAERLVPGMVEVQTRSARGRARACQFNRRSKVSNGALHGHPTFPRERFQCSKSEWNFVGLTVIEDHYYQARRCIWAHPKARQTLSIEFSAETLGARITGYGGLPWFEERGSNGAPVRLEGFVGEQSVGTFEHRDGEGWKPFSFDTSAHAGQHLPLRFEITAKSAHKREFCFQAAIREGRKAPSAAAPSAAAPSAAAPSAAAPSAAARKELLPPPRAEEGRQQ